MVESGIQQFLFGLAAIVLGFALIATWAWIRWRKLRPEIFPESSGERVPAGMNGSTITIRSGDILRMTRNWLSGQQSWIAERALVTLVEVEGAKQVTEALDGQFAKALATDDAASLLLRASDSYAYLIAVPDRYENARGAARYAGFAGGWQTHLGTLRDRIVAGPSYAPLVGYFFFLDPDGGDSALLVGFADKERTIVPSLLTGKRFAGPGDADHLSMDFRLAA